MNTTKQQPDAFNGVRTVNLDNKVVEVRELRWRDYLYVIKGITGTVLELVGPGGTTFVLDKGRIVEAIGNQEALVGWVLARSTGLTPDEVENLTAREVMPLLEAVVELNLNDEVIALGKRVAGRMADVFALKTLSPGQSISSSGPATPSKT